MGLSCSTINKLLNKTNKYLEEYNKLKEAKLLLKKTKQKDFVKVLNKYQELLNTENKITKLNKAKKLIAKRLNKIKKLYESEGFDLSSENQNILGNLLVQTYYNNTTDKSKVSPVLSDKLSNDLLIKIHEAIIDGKSDKEILNLFQEEIINTYPKNSAKVNEIQEAFNKVFNYLDQTNDNTNIINYNQIEKELNNIVFDPDETNIVDKLLLPFFIKDENNNYTLSPVYIKALKHILPSFMAQVIDPSSITADYVAKVLGYNDAEDAMTNMEVSTFYKYVNEFQEKGFPTKELETFLGDHIFNFLGLKENSVDYTIGEVNQIKGIIGNMSLKLLSEINIGDKVKLQRSQITHTDSNKLSYNVYKLVNSKTGKTTTNSDITKTFKAYASTLQRLLNLNTKVKEPSSKPIKQVDFTIKKHENYEISSQTERYIEMENNTKHVKNSLYDDFMRLVKIDKELAMQMAGYIDLNEYLEFNKLFELSKNREIELSIDNLEIYDDMIQKGIYMHHREVGNGRIMQEGPINDQNDKIHRHLLRKEKAITNIKLTDEYNSEMLNPFYISALQAFGYDVDKLTINEMNQAIEDLKAILSGENVEDSKLMKVKSLLYNSFDGNGNLLINNKPAMKELSNFTGSEEKIYTLHALKELNKLQRHIETKQTSDFTTDLPQEADGITNGMILTLLQSLGHAYYNSNNKTEKNNILKHIQELLSKGGIYTEEYIKNSNLPEELKEKFKQGILTHADMLSNGMLDFYNTLSKNINSSLEGLKGRILFDKNGELIEHKQAILNIVGEALTRSDAKPLQMVQIYGAKLESILSKFYNTGFKDKYYKAILNARKADSGNKVLVYFNDLDEQTQTDMKTILTNLYENNKNFNLEFNLFDPFSESLTKVYINTLEDLNKVQEELDNLINTYTELANETNEPNYKNYVTKLKLLKKGLNKDLNSKDLLTAYISGSLPISHFKFGSFTERMLESEFKTLYRPVLKEAFKPYNFIEDYRNNLKGLHKISYGVSLFALKHRVFTFLKNKYNMEALTEKLNNIYAPTEKDGKLIIPEDAIFQTNENIEESKKELIALLKTLTKEELNYIKQDLINSGLGFDTVSLINENNYLPLELNEKTDLNTGERTNAHIYISKNTKLKNLSVGANEDFKLPEHNERAVGVTTIHEFDSRNIQDTLITEEDVNLVLQIFDALVLPSDANTISNNMFKINKATVDTATKRNTVLNLVDKLSKQIETINETFTGSEREKALTKMFNELKVVLFEEINKINSMNKLTEFINQMTQVYKMFEDNNLKEQFQEVYKDIFDKKVLSGQYYISQSYDETTPGIYDNSLDANTEYLTKNQTNSLNNIKELTYQENKVFIDMLKQMLINNLKDKIDDLIENETISEKRLIAELNSMRHKDILVDQLLDSLDVVDINDKSNIKPDKNDRTTNSQLDPKNVIINNYTGGAWGADHIWSSYLTKFFGNKVNNVHILPISYDAVSWLKEAQKTDKTITITKASENENNIGKSINKELNNNTHDLNNRNYLQIYNADTIFAVMPIDPISNTLGDSGTRSAVKLAMWLHNTHNMKKTIYILNSNDNKLYQLDPETHIFTPVELKDVKTSRYNAFIGSSQLEDYKGAKKKPYNNAEELKQSMFNIVKHIANKQPTNPNGGKENNTNKDIIIDNSTDNNEINSITKPTDETNTNITNIQNIDEILKDITGSSLTERKKLVENLVKLGVNKDDAAMIVKMTVNKEGISNYQTLYKSLQLIKQYLLMNDLDKIHNLAIKLSKLNILNNPNLYKKVDDILTEEYNNLQNQIENITDTEIVESSPSKQQIYKQNSLFSDDTLNSSPFTSSGPKNSDLVLTSPEEAKNFLETNLEGLMDESDTSLFSGLIVSFFDIADKLNISQYINSRFNSGSAHISMTALSKSKIKISSGKYTSIQSEKEIFLHELTHLMTHLAFKKDSKLATKIYQLQQAVMDKLLKDPSIDPETFFTNSEDPSPLEREQSRALFEYIQGNPEEFFTIALTNKHLRDYINSNKFKSNIKLLNNIKEQNILHYLFNKVIDIINKIHSSIFKSNPNVSKELQDTLITAVHMTNQLYRGKSPQDIETKLTSKIYKYSGLNILNEQWKKSMTDLNKVVKEASNKMLEKEGIQKIARKINKISGKLNIDLLNIIGDVWKEVAIGNASWKDFYLLYSKAKYEQEKVRNDVEKTTIDLLNKTLLKGLNKSQKIGLTNGILKTDLLSIGHIKTMKRYFLNREDRNERISKIEEQLKAEGITGQAVINQVKALGYFLSTGKTTINNMMLNANNINNLLFDKTGTLSKLSKDYTKEIDELITLYSINYLDPHSYSVTAEYMISRSKDFTELVNFIRNTIKKDQDKLFTKDEELHKIKGHINPKKNHQYEYIYIPKSKVDYFKKLSYMEPVETNYKDPLTGDKVVMMKRINTSTDYTKSMMEVTQFNIAGDTLKHQKELGAVSEIVINQKIHTERISNPEISEDFNPANNIDELKYIPVLDPNGNIVDYRLLGTQLGEQSYKGGVTDIDEVLANTHAHNSLKVNGRELNKKLFKTLKVMYAKDKYKNQYINIKENEDLWKIIPKYTKKDLIEIYGDQPIYVHKRLINDVFGYKDPTIVNALLVNKLPEPVKAKLKIAEKLWRDVIKLVKPAIAVTNLPVLYSNFASNFFVLTEFMSTKQIIQSFRKHWLYYDKLHKEQDEIRRLEVLRKLQPLNSKERSRLKILKDSVSKNPLYPLVQNGLIGSIIEDAIDIDDLDTNIVRDKTNKALNKYLPKKVKSIIDTLWVNQNDSLFTKMLKVMQYSDAVAKATLYEHLKNNGYTEKQALLEADATFINYNINENKYLKYLSNVGLFMFSKFYLQTPKVIGNIIRRNLKGAIKLGGINEIIDIPEIYETYTTDISTALSARALNPEEALKQLIEPAIERY